MPNALELSNRSNFKRPSQSARIPIAARVGIRAASNSEKKLISIQHAFRELIQEPLFQQTSLHPPVTLSNLSSLTWIMSRIGARLGAIYTTGVTTAEDQAHIDALSQEVSALKVSLHVKALSPKEYAYQKRCFKLASQAIEELNGLCLALDKSYLAQDEWEQAIELLAKYTATPRFSGEVLLALPLFQQGMEAAEALKRQIDCLPVESAAWQCLNSSYQEFSSLFQEETIVWLKACMDAMREEVTFLQGALQEPNTENALRRLIALRNQQYYFKETLGQLALKEIAEDLALPSLLTKAMDAIREEKLSIDRLLANKNVASLPPLHYGTDAWNECSVCPKEDRFFGKRLIQALTFRPETWSDEKKEMVHKLLVGMQLSQYGIGIVEKIHQMPIGPTRPQEVIDRETGLLGKALTDNYAGLRNTQNFINKLSKGSPYLRRALDDAIKQFGNRKPSLKEINQAMDAFRMSSKYVCAEPSSQRSFSEWWTLLTTPESPIATQSESLLEQKEHLALVNEEHPLVVQENSRIPRPTASQPTLFKSMMRSLGTFLFWEKKYSREDTFAMIQVEQGRYQLNTVLTGLEQRKTELSQNTLSIRHELRREVALLQREVLRTLANKPGEQCPLPTLAIWTQEVADTCYAVKMLEERIGFLMSQARESLSVDDASLDNYGKKHANIVRMAHCIEGLQLSGVSVPIPHGISSEHMQTFLEKQSPVLFSEWVILGKEYSDYRGATPFFDEPQSKLRLETIEQGIQEAFQKAGEDEVLFHELVPAELVSWLDGVRNNKDYLMVRSTGAEDSRKTANAGGNKSPAYVLPTPKTFCAAAKEVVLSYFSFGSLQNRVNAGINPFKQLKLAVTAQQLIGEPIGGTKIPRHIPISLVLFTTEPLYVGKEMFRMMRISATYGHGEGVVGGVGIGADTVLLLISEAHPDQLYMLYENVDKPTRLAPIQTPHGVALQPVDNPKSLRYRRVLNDELLTRLYTWGVVGEKFFDDSPTDMEIVIKKGVIYPVQARPINRPNLLPTYLDMKRVAILGKTPILHQTQGSVLVPGRGSVVIITDPSTINFASTLKLAEEASHLKQYAVVMITQPEPANSHPIVNFSSLGMPCLIVNEQQIHAMMHPISLDQPLIIDMQIGTIVLWDRSKGDHQDFIIKGFAVHPAKIAISLSIAANTPKIQGEAPQEIKDLILAIGVAPKEIAQQSIQQLREHHFVASLKEKRVALSQYDLLETVQETLSILTDLGQKIDNSFEELEAVLHNAPEDARLQLLIHLKVLSNLLTEKPGTGIAQFSCLSVEPLYQAASMLIEYEKACAPYSAYFTDLVTMGLEALLPEITLKWVNFLKSLERFVQEGDISEQQIVHFKKIMVLLEKTNLLPTWYLLFFPKLDHSMQSLHDLLASFPVQEQSFLEQFLLLHQELTSQQLDLFTDPQTFEKGWGWLLNKAEQVNSQSRFGQSTLAEQLKAVSSMSQILALKTMGQLVDTFDRAIKAMKGSSQYTQQEKVRVFKKMVHAYFDILSDWAKYFDTAGIPLHENWPLVSYLNAMQERFDQMPNDDPSHLNPSIGFSVVAAMLGSQTAFERHYPMHLEDSFTLEHQNLLAILSHLGNKIYKLIDLANTFLPDLLKLFLVQLDEKYFGRPIQRLGLEMDKNGVTVKYNIPLRNHSAKMWLHYDKTSALITFKGFLLGEARTRWENSAIRLQMLDKIALPLSEPIHVGDQEMSFSWKIQDVQSFAVAKEEWRFLLEMSLDSSLEGDVLERLSTRRRLSPQSAADKIVAALIQPDNQGIHSSDPGVHKISIDVFRTIMQGGYSIEGPFIEEASKGIFDKNSAVRAAAARLVGVVIIRGKGSDALVTLIEQGIQDAEMRKTCMELLELLIPEGYGKDTVLRVADQYRTDSNPEVRHVSLKLIHALVRVSVKQQHAVVNLALSSATEGIHDVNLFNRAQSISIINSLVSLGIGMTEAIDILKIGLIDKEADTLEASSNLLETLFKAGFLIPLQKEGIIDRATTHAIESLRNEEVHFRHIGIHLFRILVANNLALEEAISGTLVLMEQSEAEGKKLLNAIVDILFERNKFVEVMRIAHKFFPLNDEMGWYSLILVNKIAAKGELLDAVFDLAEKGLDSNDYLVSTVGYTILNTLLSQGKKTHEIIDTARQRINNWRSFELIQEVIKLGKGKGINEAIEMAQEGIKHSDDRIRRGSIELMDLLVDRGLGIEAAQAIAQRGIDDENDTVRTKSQVLLEQCEENNEKQAVGLCK